MSDKGTTIRLLIGFVMFVLIIAEASLFTVKLNYFGVYYSPVVTALLSILIAIFPLFFFGREKKIQVESEVTIPTVRIKLIFCWMLFSGGIIFTALKLQPIFNEFKISVKSSDIIPAINIYVDRFLSGKEVYKTFTELGYTIEPNYLPLQWLPFSISSALNFDHRWTAFIFLAIGLSFYQYVLLKKEISFIELIIKTVLPFLILDLFISSDPGIFGMTIEPLIAGYYLMLFSSIYFSSSLVKASGILVCLLSRFSFLFWLPLYFYSFFTEKKKKFMMISVFVVIGVLLIYIIPFLSKDWESFGRGIENYTSAAIGEWYPKNWQQAGEKPYTLFRGMGFAAYFYDFADGSVEQKLSLLKKFHFGFSLLAVFLAALYFHLNKNKIDHKLYLLLSLKFYFIFFYGFIQQPYAYLNLVPVLLSVFIFSRLEFRKV